MDDFHKISQETVLEAYKGIPETSYLSNITEASVEMAHSLDAHQGIEHASAYSNYAHFDNMLPGHSGRTEFTRDTYEYFRPSEAIPRKYSDIIRTIDGIYSSVSVVRNMIDLMSDFASEGIEVCHPVPHIDKFYKDWFRKVNGAERSERFLNGIYRHGMVVIRKFYGNLNKKQRKQLDQYVIAKNIELQKLNISKYKLPLKYEFLNPGLFEHKNYHEVNSPPQYTFKVPKEIFSEDLFNNQFAQHKEINLDPSKVYIAYYKKDDWKPKPTPFLYPIIKSAIMLEKLFLADSTALDGATSKIRIFKLGHHVDPKNIIYPSNAVMSKFADILKSNPGSGTIDIVWNSAIDMIESSSEAYKFLGEAKYVPHLTQIYEGLGIPSSFVGAGSGTTNNYISLKILMKRLIAGQTKLRDFWDSQIKEVQLAMGFAEPATVEFNYLELGDEESEKNLLVQLLDRDILSSERVLKVLGYDPRLENIRVMKENKQRSSGKRADKAGQYHNGEKDFTLQKVALERGWYAPEHVGLQKAPGSEDIVSPNSERMQVMEKSKTNPGNADNGSKGGPGGRPNGAKDKVQRKTPAFAPKIKAALDIWAEETQNKIDSILKDSILATYNKKSYREFTTEESSNYELLKFGVLSNIKPFSPISEDAVHSLLDKTIDSELLSQYNKLYKDTMQVTAKKISLGSLRSIQRNAYINWLETIVDLEEENN